MIDRYIDVFNVHLGTSELEALDALRIDLSSGECAEPPMETAVATVSEFEVKAAFLLRSGLLRLGADAVAREAMTSFKARLGEVETSEVAAARELGRFFGFVKRLGRRLTLRL